MLDYRFHYAVMANEDRLRPERREAMARRRGPQRIFRLVRSRTDQGGERR